MANRVFSRFESAGSGCKVSLRLSALFIWAKDAMKKQHQKQKMH